MVEVTKVYPIKFNPGERGFLRQGLAHIAQYEPLDTTYPSRARILKYLLAGGLGMTREPLMKLSMNTLYKKLDKEESYTPNKEEMKLLEKCLNAMMEKLEHHRSQEIVVQHLLDSSSMDIFIALAHSAKSCHKEGIASTRLEAFHKDLIRDREQRLRFLRNYQIKEPLRVKEKK